MPEELKPCPFCGGEAELHKNFVECKNCTAGIIEDGLTTKELVKKWNTRTDDTVSQ